MDTLAAMREARRLGARVLSIVNVVGSTIARESDDVLYTWAGPEIAVATTKAFSTQLAVVYLIGLYCADKLGTLPEEEYDAILTELQAIPEEALRVLSKSDHVKAFLDVEMSSSGQMLDDVRLAVEGQKPVHYLGHAGGVMPTVEEMVEAAKKALKEGK